MSARLVSFDEYLTAEFEYDNEWVDGALIERNGGEFPHSRTLSLIGSALFRCEAELIPLISVRVRTGPRSVRVPDFCLVRRGTPHERVLTGPPVLVVEIKAPEDSMQMLADKNSEYRAFGIDHVWVIDPYARVAYRGTDSGLELVRTGELVIPGTPIRVIPEELFAELDRV